MSHQATSSYASASRDIPTRNPRTGQNDYTLIAPSEREIADIAARARAAQPAWRALGFEGRIEALKALAHELIARRDAIKAALEIDTGRRRMAGVEIDSALGAIARAEAAIAALPQEAWTPGRSIPQFKHAPHLIPYQLVGVISPWNFPLLLSMIDAIPALVAGCAVIVKPSEVTPRFAEPLSEAIAAVPALKDVLTVRAGDGPVGQALIENVDCICFTGSVPTGRKVALKAAERLIPAFLELGGKDPLIVLEGADLEAAADAALRGGASSAGQACQSIERIYVARPVHDRFLELLTRKAEAVRFNWPEIGKGEIGPIIFARQADILVAQIADATAKGARVLTGGAVETHGGGLWMRPTVLAGVTHDMAIMREETFGPIMPVMPFDEVDEAVSLANDSDYGLSAAVFAADLEEAATVGRRIEAGAISLNDASLTAMFSEAAKNSFKSSGIGPSRMGSDGLVRFFRRKALIANTGRPVPIAALAEEL